MAEKRGSRWVHEFVTPDEEGWHNSAVRLTLTRQGVEMDGWYDGFVGIEGRFISWAEFDAAREAVMKGRAALGDDHE